MANETKPAERTTPEIVWDDSEMRNTYSNVVNVAATREEISLLFGTNTAWQAGTEKVRVQLSDRMVLTPFAAKRLLALLGNAIQTYESQNGEINIASRSAAPPAE